MFTIVAFISAVISVSLLFYLYDFYKSHDEQYKNLDAFMDYGVTTNLKTGKVTEQKKCVIID